MPMHALPAVESWPRVSPGFPFVLGVALMLMLMVLAVVAVVLVAAGRRRARLEEERQRRASRELERIDAMTASGRITPEEAAELREALQDHPGSVRVAGQPAAPLRKSASPLLLGVCGGLADWLGWDVTIVRLVYALATILLPVFPGIIMYLVLAVVMPAPEGGPEASARRGWGVGCLVAILLVVLLAALAVYLPACLRLTRLH